MTEAKKVLVIINPKSGGRSKAQLSAMIKQALEDQELDYAFYETTGAGDEEKLREEIGKLKPERVLVAGGDGTVNMAAGLLAKRPIILGILPMGSANGLARELCIPEDENTALQIALGKHTRAIDAITLENHGLALHLSDIGLNATLIKHYAEANEHGFFSYVKHALKSFRDQSVFHIVLRNGKKVWKKKVYMLVIANASMYGTGIKVNPAGSLDDGKFEVLLLKGINYRNLWKRITGRRELMQTIQTDYIKINTVEKMSFQIDGEYMGEVDEVRAEIIPACITVAVPVS